MSHDTVRAALTEALRQMGLESVDVHLERPRDSSHGDLATNVALTLASRLGRAPRSIAEELVSHLSLEGSGIESVEVAGPGFLNFSLSTGEVASVLESILRRDRSYGRCDGGAGRAIMVEFVSANPTGPLHLGHGRQAALGDAVSSLLEWTGWKVQREFYYNDAGRQIERLARSVRARYHQHFGKDEPIPEDGYHGEYVAEIAAGLAGEYGEGLLDDRGPEALDAMRRYAVRVLRGEQDRDLTRFRVRFDEYYLESSLYEDGRVDQTVLELRKTGLVYEKDGAVWLRTTRFGDQKDRVMLKWDGSPTYFLPDVAYHVTKWERGFRHAINVQGSDHHGTVSRVRAGLQALGLPEGYPEYVLHQMVRVVREGREVKLSKRAGSYLTLQELLDEAGVDVVRYFFLMRKAEGELLFDLDLALEQSEKNPVFKSQYAHARMCSIFRKAGIDMEEMTGEGVDLTLLDTPAERDLIQRLGAFPELVEKAAELRSPHLLCDYLEQTAGAVNSWYHSGNPARNPELAVLIPDPRLRGARLVLARAIRIVLRNALGILGISAPLRMERAEAESGEDS
jgi:arginyl-tRNA synthetase